MSEAEVPPTPPAPPEPPESTPPPPMEPPAPPSGGSENRGIMIVLAYLWPLAVIPLLVEKDDREVQWHAKHGLVLFAAEIVVWIVLFAVSALLSSFDCGCTGCLLYSGFWIAILVVHILCIVKGVKGERFIIPQISQLADRF